MSLSREPPALPRAASGALRPAAVPAGQQPGDDPTFRAAVAELEAAVTEQRELRPEVSFDGEPPPRRLAPQAAAVGATVEIAGSEIGWGRFVLLYDPAGQDGWAGPFRVIAYVRAALEPEIAADPLVGQVGWSWLTEALDARAAEYTAPSGTVTRVVTEGFGTKQDEPTATEFEMRASWSPVTTHGTRFELDRHLAAWADTLCQAAGLPPLPPGVAQLRPPQLRQPRARRRS
ncbi:MAG TPA: DUF3000 domain-containing protein [Streptosporangiaceae bacterium]